MILQLDDKEELALCIMYTTSKHQPIWLFQIPKTLPE